MFVWQICYPEMKIMLQLTINGLQSHRQPQSTLRIVCEDGVLFVWVDLHVSLFGQQHAKRERAIGLVYPPFFIQHHK